MVIINFRGTFKELQIWLQLGRYTNQFKMQHIYVDSSEDDILNS